jgi:hypothetical protein
MTVLQRNKLRIQWRMHNKNCRRRHIHSAQFLNFEDYIEYINGEYKAPEKQLVNRNPYQPPKVRETKQYPSVSNNIGGIATRREPMKYTGKRRLLGIATMHKSNMVPIFEDNKEEAIEIARMRR